MSDRYSQLVRLPVAGGLAKRVGLPQPVTLDRYTPGDPLVRGRVLLGGAGRVAEAAARVLAGAGVDAATALDDPVRSSAAAAGLDAAVFNPEAPADQRFKALIFDATGITSSAQLVELQRFFHPTVRRVLPSGRVIVLGGGRRALEGFTRSLGKEIGRGATVNLVHVEEGAEDRIGPTLRFFLSPRSAYVSGQVAHVGPGAEAPLAGRTALVTGASRGIGASIATVLEREGASVVRLDLKDADLELDLTADGRAGAARRALLGRARHPRPQRGRDQGPHAGQDARGPLAEPDGGQPARARADHRGAAAAVQRRRADRLRLVDERDRRQLRPDELRDLEGRAARPRLLVAA